LACRGETLKGLEVIRQAWTSDRVSHHGRFYEIERIAVVPKPVQQPHPPIRIADNIEDTFCNDWPLGFPIFVASQVNPFHRIKRFLPIYHEARNAAGHPDCAAEDVTVPLYVGESAEQVRREVEPSIKTFLSAVTSLYFLEARRGVRPCGAAPQLRSSARLVVGADGRSSTVRAAGPHNEHILCGLGSLLP
jgi:alkanesulfonate monooxygenase SsuD/methylene tetrahydromethanopterin reductase-like flavin-dependent oxidoreductase (luciferase family)